MYHKKFYIFQNPLITMENLYENDKFSIKYDPNKEGYWLSIDRSYHFMQEEEFTQLYDVKGLNLLVKLRTIDPVIQLNLDKKNISPFDLEEALHEVRKIEDKQFEDFKQSNNL